MEQYILLVCVASVVQFILGALWYSPVLFGKQWMEIMEVTLLSDDEMKKMQKSMAPFYILQILLTLVSTLTLAKLITLIPGQSAYVTALLVYGGYIVPTQIASVIWANTKKEYWLKQILIMCTYQGIAITLATYIVTY
jgi:hypothetical protein